MALVPEPCHKKPCHPNWYPRPPWLTRNIEGDVTAQRQLALALQHALHGRQQAPWEQLRLELQKGCQTLPVPPQKGALQLHQRATG